MFTVNHVKDGVETIYSTATTTYVGASANFGPGGLLVDGPSKDAPPIQLRGGKAFVMNADGRTVASYVLPENTEKFQQGGAANAVGRIERGFSGGRIEDAVAAQRIGSGGILGG